MRAERDPGVPIAQKHVGVDERRAARSGPGRPAAAPAARASDTGSWRGSRRARLAGRQCDVIGQPDGSRQSPDRTSRARSTHVEFRRMRTLVRSIELVVIERRLDHVVHGVAGRDAGHERAHQEPRDRRRCRRGNDRCRAPPRPGCGRPEARARQSPDSRDRAHPPPAPRRRRARRSRACGPESSSRPLRSGRRSSSDNRGSSSS